MASRALLTDLYQLTMANGYYKTGLHDKQSCFQHFFRKAPFGSSFVVAAGFQSALEFVQDFHYEPDDIAYLASLGRFDAAFLDFLSTFKLNVRIDALDEGTLAFGLEVMIRVSGPLLHCQLLETALLNIVNFQSLIATKAARCVYAAKGKEVIDFGLRRAQGPDGGLSASRAAFIGGCTATSNVLAGQRFGLPVKGTMAHSWIMAFGDEKKAFLAYAETMPGPIVLLVDTYHTRTGILHAIEVAKVLATKDRKLHGIRLDSGNLEELSKMARAMLDEAGLFDVTIMASGDLDEYKIAELVDAESPIDSFGVGTRLVTAYDEPALGGVYKLAAIADEQGHWHPCMKISDDVEKATLPGVLQTRRELQGGRWVRDVIYADGSTTALPSGEDLLKPLKASTLGEAQARARLALSRLDDSQRQLVSPRPYPVIVHPDLRAQKDRAMKQVPM